MTEPASHRLNDNAPALSVSVVIVSWNAREYLRQCLDALSAEACCCPTEIVVVDNASADGSAELVESQYPLVRLIRNPANLGFSKANNLGIMASSGRYVCLINSDVKVMPHSISLLVNYCEEHPDAGMVGPLVIGGDGELQRSCRGFPNLWNMFCRALALDTLFPMCKLFTGYWLWHWPQDCLCAVDILTGCFWLVRRQALTNVGLLDESFFMYGEDMDWCKRFWEKGWQVVFVPSAQAIHYGGASSSSAPVRFYVERQRADLRYWQKHYSPVAVWCYFLLTCLHLLLRAIGHSLALLFQRSGRASRQHGVRRSLAGLKWMLSAGIKQCCFFCTPTFLAPGQPADLPTTN